MTTYGSLMTDVSHATENDPHDVEAMRKRIADLEALLYQNDLRVMCAYRLPRQLADLLGLLLATPLVTLEGMQRHGGFGQQPRKTISRLRDAVKPFGIEVMSQRNVGYWLTPEGKARIRETVEATYDH